MNSPVVDNFIEKLKKSFKTEFKKEKRSIRAIYQFGSYIRGDFVERRSNLDFVTFFDSTGNDELNLAIEMSTIKDILKKSSLDLPHRLLRAEGIEMISISMQDLDLAVKSKLLSCKGPNRYLTFYAFDFVKYSDLLWGENVLQKFRNFPNPRLFAEERLSAIADAYRRKEISLLSEESLVFSTLESLIRYLAIMDGCNDLSRTKLQQWSLDYQNWPSGAHEILTAYFNFSQGLMDEKDLFKTDWMTRGKELIDKILVRLEKV